MRRSPAVRHGARGAARWATGAALGLWLAAGRLLGAQEAGDPAGLLTRAERSGYRETSTYQDVLAFVREVSAASPLLHETRFGYTLEGRALPLVVAGAAPDATADAVRTSGKLRVFIQANIHGGEVCGKEASLMLLRALAGGAHAQWLDSLVLLVAPIYNADGNERVRLTNRPLQHGPIGGMGERANAQDLDLNRDHMKLESPEARSLVALFRTYDPHVVIDLHTTNGTRHAYHITYAPPLHPDTDARIVTLLRNEWLPQVTATMEAETGWASYYYGNVPRSPQVERGWYTFDHRPRFNNNYVGLRNRVAILSEAYAYATFEERVRATLVFVERVVDYAYRHASAVRQAVTRADAESVVGRDLALRSDFARTADQTRILLGSVDEERHPYTGAIMLRRTAAQRPEWMPEFGTFRPTETARAPAAYAVPGRLDAVVDLLDAHGIRWEHVAEPFTATVQRFIIDSTTVAERAFQGHQERTLFGRYQADSSTVAAGDVLVRVDQPLGRLIFALLEPRADDGLVAWNVLDEELERAQVYPILRLPARLTR